MPKRVSTEEIEEAAKMFLAGKESTQDLEIWLGVDRNQIYRWAKTYRRLGVEGLNAHHAQYHGKMPQYSRETKDAAVKASAMLYYYRKRPWNPCNSDSASHLPANRSRVG